MFAAAKVYAQPNIFNPNDSIVLYNSFKPPATPPENTMAKWVKTTTRITWSTTKFKSYYWNGMVFRLRFPNNYNANDTTKKYPVILFFHGAGEIKPIYDNEDQLFWGAEPFQAKIDSGKFNAFLLFPQVSSNSWDWFYQVKVNSVLDSMQKYCHTDPDKLIAMGLSNGALTAMQYAVNFPTRVSTVIASSPALIELLQETQNTTIHIPHWLASGGIDNSPGPYVMNNYVNAFNAKGGDIRYSFYPQWGHNIWELQWSEPYLVPYWTAAHKANPLIFYKNSQFCPGTVTAHLGLTAGFAEYQWQVNNTNIPNSNSNEIIGTQIGSYRARFRRTAGGDWSDWSLVPAVITALPMATSPSITVTGTRSVVLPAPDGSTTVPLELPAGFAIYEWRRVSDSALVSSQRTFTAPVGQYKGKATNCTATFSPVFNVFSATGTPKPDSARTVTLSRLSPTSFKLSWTEVTNPVSNETGFEIYRGSAPGGPYTLATITAANIKTYTDTALDNNFNYYYVIRAVNATGASGLSKEISLQPTGDVVAPTVPGNLRAAFTSRTYINLEWDSSSDNIGVTAYDVYVNNVLKYTAVVPKITVDSLTPNTSYTFKVTARDQTGNVSAASNVITARSVANGLKYRVYQGAWDVLPDFSALTPIATGSSPNVDILTRPSGVNDNFGYVWEGFISIPVAGTYKFETMSDDGSKLYYNTFYSPTATALVNNDGLHSSAVAATGSVTISEVGVHPIAITFFDRTGGESMQVYWTGPGIPRQLIPNAAFIESPTNRAPIANAGADSTTILPVNSIALSGSGTDSDGIVNTYAWTQVSGPNTATFSSKTVATPTVSGLVVGSYVFSLIVTDNELAISVADQVTIKVTAGSLNQVPAADAGPDKSITLPASSITLNGAGSDADGTISAYVWTQVSGPDTATFSSKTVAVPTVSSLKAGTYVFSLIVTDNQSAVSTADQVTVTVNAAGNTPVYRINAGGTQVTTSIGVFTADAYFSPTPGNTASTTSAIAGTTDDAIYQSVRYGGAGTMNYAFPVTNGQYTVILHFAEGYLNNVGNRVFDVSLENTKVLDNYDIFKKAGANTATTEILSTNVTDGVLNIYFSSLAADGGANSPMVSAIEIIRTSTNLAPVAHVPADSTITLPASSLVLAGSGTDADGTISAYSWTQVSGPNTATFSSKIVAAPTVSGLVAGNYVFSLIVTDNQSTVSAADQVTITVNAAGSTPVYRINAGGTQVTTSIGVFAADAYYSPIPGNTASSTSAIAGTTDDVLYQSVRYGAAGTINYAFPVTNGQYTVILHFAEAYFNNVGNRVFDVTLESTKVLDNYDIFKKAGANTATTESTSVNVTDGLLNIYFSSLAADGGANSPMVCAIEIIKNSGLLPGNSDSSTQRIMGTTSEAAYALTSVNGSATDVANLNAVVTKAYPNPFTENLKIQFSSVTSSNKVMVGVYDMTGRMIQQQYFGSLSAGVNTLSINLDRQMMPGMYLVRLDVDGKPLKLWKMVKQKK